MAFTYPHSNNVVLGAGRIYFATETSSTVEGTAFTYLGDTPGFTIGGTAEQIVVDSSDTPVAEELVRIVKKVSRESTVTLRDISPSNLALFMMGSSDTATQATGAVTGTLTAVTKGKYYKLGGDDVQDVTVATGGIVLGATASGTPLTVTTDYQLDLAQSMIYFTTGGSATGTIHYTLAKVATTWTHAQSAAAPVYGTLLFVSDNTVGNDVRVKISRCSLAPNGEAQFKSRDNAMELAMTLGILSRGSNPQVEIWGEPA